MEADAIYAMNGSSLTVRLLKVPAVVAEEWCNAKASTHLGSISRKRGIDVITVTSQDKGEDNEDSSDDGGEMANPSLQAPKRFKLTKTPADGLLLQHFIPASGERSGMIRIEGLVPAIETLTPLQGRPPPPSRAAIDQANKPLRRLHTAEPSSDGLQDPLGGAKPEFFNYAHTNEVDDDLDTATSRDARGQKTAKGLQSGRQIPAGGAATPTAAPMAADKLRESLFRHFERSQAWHFKELQASTRQPSGFLKAVLEQIAVPSRMPNEQKMKYVLKPEYSISAIVSDQR